MTSTAEAWVNHLRQHMAQGRVLFHGSGHSIDAFTEESIGRGQDANAALGVHLAEYPDHAGEYAEASAEFDPTARLAQVYVVVVPARAPTQELNEFFAFFGEPDSGIPGQLEPLAAKSSGHFAAERQRLLAAGHDLVDYEDGEQVIAVALNPADVILIGTFPADQAMDVREVMEVMEATGDCPAHQRLAAIAPWIEAWRSTPKPSTPKNPPRARNRP